MEFRSMLKQGNTFVGICMDALIRTPAVAAQTDPWIEATRALRSSIGMEQVTQVHALEHGTIWVLSEKYPKLQLGGASTNQGFYVYGQVDPQILLAAAREALERFKRGEADLAVHPRCGTNLSVGMLLTMGFAFGFNLLLPRRLPNLLMGAGLAAMCSSLLSPSLGAKAQKYVTTDIPMNLSVTGIKTQTDWMGRKTHFVQTHYHS
jgi:Domain of unknown function (DUF6391)